MVEAELEEVVEDVEDLEAGADHPDVEDAVPQDHDLVHVVEVIREVLVGHVVGQEVLSVVLENTRKALLVDQEVKVEVAPKVDRDLPHQDRVRLLLETSFDFGWSVHMGTWLHLAGFKQFRGTSDIKLADSEIEVNF